MVPRFLITRRGKGGREEETSVDMAEPRSEASQTRRKTALLEMIKYQAGANSGDLHREKSGVAPYQLRAGRAAIAATRCEDIQSEVMR